MRKKQNASQFLEPISLKITPARRKKGARRREKKAMVELLVFILATLDEKLLKLLVVPFSIIRLDIFSKHCIGQRHKITTSEGKRSLKLKTKKSLNLHMFVPEH